MVIKKRVQFDIKSRWHIGDNYNGGFYADNIQLKDLDGLPYIPGKTIKGLLRDAFNLALDNDWFEKDYVEKLFGSETKQGIDRQALLNFTSAILPSNNKKIFKNGTKSNDLKKYLYQTIQTTSIDNETSVAKDSSLRTMETVIAMCLYSEIELNQQILGNLQLNSQEVFNDIAKVLPLITEFGAKRTRGFGRVNISLYDKQKSSK